MRVKWVLAGLLMAGVMLALADNKSAPDGLPGCSGLVGWGTDRYVVSHDLKAAESGARFGLVHTHAHFDYQPLDCDWSAVGVAANDLESVAPIEGLPGQFLAAESGYFRGQYGRFFWLQGEEGATPRLKALRKYALPTNLHQEIEGLATYRLDSNRWLVLLGGRGGKAEEPGRLFWGVLDQASANLEWPAAGLKGIEIHLPRRLGPYARSLSDMFIDDKHHLWISSCSSPGQAGPNRSLIFQAGTVHDDLKQPFRRNVEGQAVWWVDGCKIEGLTGCGRPGYGPAYVTDDDDLGGIWRAVPGNPSLSY
ncbi:hypothetical protein IV102_09150 [bacterium]|nr:hypothetical protein [bacterium]